MSLEERAALAHQCSTLYSSQQRAVLSVPVVDSSQIVHQSPSSAAIFPVTSLPFAFPVQVPFPVTTGSSTGIYLTRANSNLVGVSQLQQQVPFSIPTVAVPVPSVPVSITGSIMGPQPRRRRGAEASNSSSGSGSGGGSNNAAYYQATAHAGSGTASKRQRLLYGQHPHHQPAHAQMNHVGSGVGYYTVSDEDRFSSKRCVALFQEYTSADNPKLICPEAMEKFCEDIAVEPENIVMLVLAWKMQAKQMGFFSEDEWLRGMTEIQCDSIAKIQQRLEYLRSLLEDTAHFKSIYRYAFDFARDKDQRCMDLPTAKAMLQLLLGKHWSLHVRFQQFLDQSKYRVLTKDQWFNILEFSRSIRPDLSNYDEDGAWPVLLDEFAEWLRTHTDSTATPSGRDQTYGGSTASAPSSNS